MTRCITRSHVDLVVLCSTIGFRKEKEALGNSSLYELNTVKGQFYLNKEQLEICIIYRYIGLNATV